MDEERSERVLKKLNPKFSLTEEGIPMSINKNAKKSTRSETIDSLVMKVPSNIPDREAGSILSHAREELDVSLAQLIATAPMSRTIAQSFESTEIPLTPSIWKGYVTAIRNRHGVSAAKASGLLHGLAREIIHYGDHKRDL